jgi:hypothetical protein
VREVEDDLVVRVAVNRHHGPVLEPERVADDFDHGHEAVCGAGRVRQDMMRLGVILVAVDAHHERDVFALGGRRDDDLLGTGVDVLLRVGGVGEAPRRFEHDVDLELAPGQLAGILFREDPDTLAVDADRVALGGYRALIRPVHGVIREQMGQRFRIGQVVDGDEFEVGDPLLLRGP